MKQKHEELIKAWAEGAIIQYYNESIDRWVVCSPTWSDTEKYRIKGNIPIESWNKHKHTIICFWGGALIDFQAPNMEAGEWHDTNERPSWIENYSYRVRPKTMYCRFKKLNVEDVHATHYVEVGGSKYAKYKRDGFTEMRHKTFKEIT